jgi:hypothetical protein
MSAKCVGPKEQKLFADRCFKPATHTTIMGPRCADCAELLRKALRDPNTLGNILAGNRLCTRRAPGAMFPVQRACLHRKSGS